MNPVERVIKEQLEARGFRVLRNGWPDFLCIRKATKKKLAVGYYTGGPTFTETYGLCAVEVKAKGDTVSEAQAEMHKALRSVGIPVFIMGRGADPKTKVKHFLTNKEIQHFKDRAEKAREDIAYLQAQIDAKQHMVEELLTSVDECCFVLDESVAALDELDTPEPAQALTNGRTR